MLVDAPPSALATTSRNAVTDEGTSDWAAAATTASTSDGSALLLSPSVSLKSVDLVGWILDDGPTKACAVEERTASDIADTAAAILMVQGDLASSGRGLPALYCLPTATRSTESLWLFVAWVHSTT